MATKRKTPTTSTLTCETTSAPRRLQRDANAEIAADQVARLAYAKFLERGGQHGHDVDEWLAAEGELRS